MTEEKKRLVNAWTEWGTLEEVMVGRVDGACCIPAEPNCKPHFNDPDLAKLIHWPIGLKSETSIKLANEQLDQLAEILSAETVKVYRTEEYDHLVKEEVEKIKTKAIHSGEEKMKHGVQVRRPSVFEFNRSCKTPDWEITTMNSSACPRDVLITLGNTILEAPMALRSRFFEYLPYRETVRSLWQQDPLMHWIAAPKPSMADKMYDTSYFAVNPEQRRNRSHQEMWYVLKNDEPTFDAASVSRVGIDLFVEAGMTTNKAGIDWLKREFGHIYRIHEMHFLDDLEPMHIDGSFVPLRPPKGLFGTEGLALFCPDRPPLEAEIALFHNNNWKLLSAATPATDILPALSQTSRWVATVNVLSLSEKCLVVEESEIAAFNMLTDLGFDVITTPFRNFYEFGGGIHCATWDIRRDDKKEDYFPDQSNHIDIQHLDQSFRYYKIHKNHTFCIKPVTQPIDYSLQQILFRHAFPSGGGKIVIFGQKHLYPAIDQHLLQVVWCENDHVEKPDETADSVLMLSDDNKPHEWSHIKSKAQSAYFLLKNGGVFVCALTFDQKNMECSTAEEFFDQNCRPHFAITGFKRIYYPRKYTGSLILHIIK